jgi:hypothetical protein
VTVGSGETFQVGDGFDVPNDEVVHPAHSIDWLPGSPWHLVTRTT